MNSSLWKNASPCLSAVDKNRHKSLFENGLELKKENLIKDLKPYNESWCFLHVKCKIIACGA